jgi:hypothetical protein
MRCSAWLSSCVVLLFIFLLNFNFNFNLPYRHYLFTSEQAALAQYITLSGSAVIESRILKLTSASQLNSRGVAFFDLSTPPFPPLADFILDLDCLIGLGSGGSGLSISIGDHIGEDGDGLFGEQGSGNGLRVLLRTRTAKIIEVSFAYLANFFLFIVSILPPLPIV